MTTNSSKTSGSSLILIDSRVTGYQTLIDNLAEAGEVFIIDAESDGVVQIAAKLQGRSDIDALHIITRRLSPQRNCQSTKNNLHSSNEK